MASTDEEFIADPDCEAIPLDIPSPNREPIPLDVPGFSDVLAALRATLPRVIVFVCAVGIPAAIPLPIDVPKPCPTTIPCCCSDALVALMDIINCCSPIKANGIDIMMPF